MPRNHCFRRDAAWLFLAMLAWWTPVTARAAEASDAGTTASALAAGNAAAAAFDIEGAVKAYRGGVDRDSTSSELWWRLARSYTDRGARAEYDGKKDRAEAAYADAVHAARKATALAPDGPNGHLELAVALGRLALFRGGSDKIRFAKEVKAEADRAVGLDPNLDRAYHVLARWNRGIAELSFFEKAGANTIYGGLPKGASMNNAVTLFEKAIALAPDYANHHVELGRTYEKLGLKDKARAEYELALACPRKSVFDPEYKTEAQRLLSKLN
jgi:tetratricopeptide (TPR) repeat protein